jgi:hypothetical protein
MSGGHSLSVENREYQEQEKPSALPPRSQHCRCRRPVWRTSYWGRRFCLCGMFEKDRETFGRLSNG